MAMRTLGLDSSTQSLSALILEEGSAKPLLEMNVEFDAKLPEFRTTHGVLRSSDPKVVHAPPMMWVAALDALFSELRGTGFDLGSIQAISGSGQQHGSVCLGETAEKKLRDLDPGQDLNAQLEGIFSRPTSPVWMDSSTTAECEEIMDLLGGRDRTARLTGSIAFERFTGPQIRKFHKEQDDLYRETRWICLVSSFMASLLVGKIAGVDPGDGAGTNLMDISRRQWSPDACEATAPALLSKLKPVVSSHSIVGSVHSYFVERYGFSKDCQVIAWSGDNPNSLAGVGLYRPGQVAISLGTSDTLFGPLAEVKTDPRGEGHVFGSPMGGYMSLICFKNGSLARERIRDAYGLDWRAFSEILDGSAPGNAGKVLLPYFEPEIVPRVLCPGVRRFNLSEDDMEGHVRGVVEAQMTSMRLHSQWMGVKTERIHATGGASRNRSLLQVMADVFQAEVVRPRVSNSAALGAAMRALHGITATGKFGGPLSWREIAETYVVSEPSSRIEPNEDTSAVYEDLLARYGILENEAISVQ